MEVEIRIEPGRQEPKAVILAGEESEDLRRLAERLSELALGPIPVSRGEEKLLLPQREFLRFYTDGKGVSAQTAEGVWSVPLRLYELEEGLRGEDFLRAGRSAIVNFRRVKSIRPELGGRLLVTMDNGEQLYVSRQYAVEMKEKLRELERSILR